MKKVYLVEGGNLEAYEGHDVWIVGAFSTLKKAGAFKDRCTLAAKVMYDSWIEDEDGKKNESDPRLEKYESGNVKYTIREMDVQ